MGYEKWAAARKSPRCWVSCLFMVLLLRISAVARLHGACFPVVYYLQGCASLMSALNPEIM